ncbi:MAG: nucleotidyltransferase domain-containing protein [Candidatus Brockarchaeota archaeon]|nr:nucleotidyltransferase domain-containing protein [Candidatus Brockarchaeota archaeon]
MLVDKLSCDLLLLLAESEGARFGGLMGVIRNPKTLKRKLDALSSLGLVEKRNKLYAATEKGRDVAGRMKDILSALGDSGRNDRFDRVPSVYAPLLKRYCDILRKHYGERLAGVLLFGSVARGDWGKDSDIDLLVAVDGWAKPPWERSRELQKLRGELRGSEEYRKLLLKGYVPVIQHYPLDSSEAGVVHRIYLDACVEAIVLYERGDFLSAILSRVRERLRQLGARRVLVPGRGHVWVLSDAIPRGGLVV